MMSSNPNHLPEAPLPNTMVREGRASVYRFGEDTNILSLAATFPGHGYGCGDLGGNTPSVRQDTPSLLPMDPSTWANGALL